MAHLAGIDKGPEMDWTNDNGLDERYRKWKKKVEVLFKGPLNSAVDAIKCNYIIYWSGDHGMDLVDKWDGEGKIDDTNRNELATYWNLFEEYIHPEMNQLIAVVELKQLFQGSMSLEDFHTKALCFVKQAGHTGATKDRVLRDTIISGISSDRIRGNIVKEGKDVTLAQVMEIARLEVSTQNHLDRMQETPKINYVQYGKSTKNKKGKRLQPSTPSTGNDRGSRGHGTQPRFHVEKAGKFHCPQEPVIIVAKGDIKKMRNVKLWKLSVKVVTRRGTLRRSV